MSNNDTDLMLLVILGLILSAALFVSFIIYVCKGIMLYRLCKENDIKQKWLAWVPIGNDFMMLKLGEVSTNFVWVFVAEMVCSIVANFEGVGEMLIFEVIYFITSLLGSLLTIYTLKRIHKKYQRGKVLLVVAMIYFVMVLISVVGIIL